MLKPKSLGLPAKFGEFRPQQYDAIWKLSESDTRLKVAVCPTGFGKSLMYIAYALLRNARTIILTSTRPLETRIVSEFQQIGLVDVRGANNYECTLPAPDGRPHVLRMADRGWCRAGVQCHLREHGCAYYDARRAAVRADIVVTNYSYWMSQYAYGEGLGPWDLLVLDEAHDAPAHLAEFLGVRLTDTDLTLLGLGQPHADRWPDWAGLARRRVEQFREMTGSSLDDTMYFKQLASKLDRLLIGNPADWVLEHDGTGVRWDIVYPGAHAERFLLLGIKEILLTSATVRPKTLSMLGLSNTDAQWLEYRSTFSVHRRRVYYTPKAKISWRTDAEGMRPIHDTIDQIIEARQDRKGLIQSASYSLTQSIVQASRFPLLSHERRGAEDAVELFRSLRRSAILISPAVSTGIDLPYSDCEFIIIPKIPFPDLTSRIVRARTSVDRHYAIFLALQTVEQMVGRAMRASDDQCEIFILDSNFGWLMRQHGSFTSQGFRRAIRRRNSIPSPPPRLADFPWKLTP